MRLKMPASFDPFLLVLICDLAAASILPCRGQGAAIFGWITDAAITSLFFLHGAKLSRDAILSGVGHWRLHLIVATSTFILFPLLGLTVRALGAGWMNPSTAAGILFLCLLPSTVQSSIAFTSIARGNVPAAVCSASLSNIGGIVLTPLLVSALMGVRVKAGGGSAHSIEAIALQLLLPFVLGHLARPWIGPFLDRHKRLMGGVDRSSILLVIYTAFSAAVVEGIWRKLSVEDLAIVMIATGTILTVALAATTWSARLLGFSREDEIAIVFCGSKKSLASGVPMAGVLFPVAAVGGMIVPLMLFHQIQLMVCAVLAKRFAMRARKSSAAEVAAA